MVRHYAGPGLWEELERKLGAGEMTLRDVLATQAAHVGATLDEADELLTQRTQFDPTFAPFVACCEERGHELVVVSSGVQPLIDRAFERNGLSHVRVLANGIDAAPAGWQFRFRDESENGHDKARAVRRARASGKHTIYIGDGPSDFAAAIEADERYAKAGRGLERHLAEQAIPFVTFTRFSEIQPYICR